MIILFIVSNSENESTFSMLHSVFNSIKSVPLRLTGKHNSRKGRAIVGDGIISGTIFLRTISVDHCSQTD
jgi:hypothetical protein